MTIVNKPDFTLFASEAKTGEVETFPNLLRGWGVTLEQTAGKPPMEWFNALQQRTDHWLMYLSQRGIPTWDSRLTYPLFAVVQHAGKFYVAKKESSDQPPDTSQNVWMSMAAALDLPAGSLTEKGMLQLSNAINSDSETMAATPKAVKAVIQQIEQTIEKLRAPRFATFVNSGAFTVPEGVTTLYVSGCGAGGGGGGGLGYLNGYTVGGGGGGAGQAVIRKAIAVTPGKTLKIEVGISGKGGAGGAHNNSGVVGGDGGLTALGDLLTLSGGTGGPAGVGGTNGYGGAGYPYGETAIGGNLNGMNTFYLTAASGASCAFGGGGPGGHVGSQGAHHARPAYGYGAGGGGGGGTRIAGTSGGNGGNGVGGLLMLEW